MRNTSILLLFLLIGAASHAQSPIKTLVDSQHYTFNAQMAMPMTGHTVQLTGDSYDLEISRNTIVSYLPYFGRAYSAPLDPARAGIQFTTKDFDYTVTPKAKGGWDVLIKTKGMQDAWQLSLNITVDGYATLQVTGGNRQPISFSGMIVPAKPNH